MIQINKGKGNKIEYHHFATTSEVMDLSCGLLETVQTTLWEPTVHICSNPTFSDTLVRVKWTVTGVFIP